MKKHWLIFSHAWVREIQINGLAPKSKRACRNLHDFFFSGRPGNSSYLIGTAVGLISNFLPIPEDPAEQLRQRSEESLLAALIEKI